MRLYLRAGGKLREWRGDGQGVAAAWAALPADGKVVLAAQNHGGDSFFAVRGVDGGFHFRVVEQSGADAIGHRKSRRRDHDEAEARRLLEAFVAGDKGWRNAIAWRRGIFDLPVAILAPATFAIAIIGIFIVEGVTGGLKDWSWRYLPNLLVGLAMMGAIFAYIDWFFRRLRRRLAGWLGARFGLQITEQERYGFFSRPGMWEDKEGGLVSDLAVAALDIVVLFLGLVIPIFAIGTIIVLAARPILA